MTKKQIKALQDIAADLQCKKDSQLAFENDARAEKNKPPLPRRVYGEKKTPTGYTVIDGYVGVYYHESAPDVPQDEEYDDSTDWLRHEIEEQLYNGDYCIVTAPFFGTVRASQIRPLLKEYTMEETALGTKRKLIELRSDLNDRPMVSSFNPTYVRRAVEAVGGTVRLFIGQHRRKKQPYPFLIVVPDNGSFNLDNGVYAIVMPIVRR